MKDVSKFLRDLFFSLFSLSFFKEKNSFRKDIFFEMNRYDAGETHRGTFEIQEVLQLYKSNRVAFFAVAHCHEEDARPYLSCFGIVEFPYKPSDVCREQIRSFFTEEKNSSMLFNSIFFFGIERNKLAFGPACSESLQKKIKKIFPDNEIIPWEKIKKMSKEPQERNESVYAYSKEQAKAIARLLV